MERSLLHYILAALLLAGALSSCQKSPAAPDRAPGESASIAYALSIPAAFEGEDPDTKALEFGTGDKAGWLISTFRTTDNIYVYNKTRDLVAQETGYTKIYLHPDADSPTANLAGTLKFWKYSSGYQTVEVGDVLGLIYNSQGLFVDYFGLSGIFPLGSFQDLNRFDFAAAEVAVTGISGSANGGYTITTGPAVFQNAQSMFKFTFTGLPGSLLDTFDYNKGIKTVTIHSAGGKLLRFYSFFNVDTPVEGDIKTDIGRSDISDGFTDPASRRHANGPGVVYAALRFQPLDDENATDLISFTVECTDNKTYVGSKVSPKGGFKNGKYYTATVSLAPVGAVHGHFTVNDSGKKVYFSKGNLQAKFTSAGSSCTWQFAEHQYDYVGNAVANTSINGSGSVSGAGAVDLFGWTGDSRSEDNYGIWDNDPGHFQGAASEGLKHDWGHNAIANGGNEADQWRTLSQTEWEYLFAHHPYGMATVNGVHGIILLPEGTSLSIKTDHSDFTDNEIPASDWDAVYESAGAVFLPAAGYRNSGVTGCGVIGNYWSSSSTDADRAKVVSFEKNSVNASGELVRYIGMSVRLVQDLE